MRFAITSRQKWKRSSRFLADGPPTADTMLEPLVAMPEICLAAGVQARASEVFARLYENMLR